MQQWHDVKVRRIDEGPDDLRSAAIASLNAFDFEDAAVIAAFLEHSAAETAVRVKKGGG